MTLTGWVIFLTLVILIAIIVTQFGRLGKFFLNLHRDERRESYKVIRSLEKAIREAAGTTNIFHADGQVNNDTATGVQGEENDVDNNQ